MKHNPAERNDAKEPKQTRILLVDDHAIIRQAFRDLIEREPGLVVCGEAADGVTAMRLLSDARPDVVFLDVSLGQTNGLDLIEPMLSADPALRILILSVHDAETYAPTAIRAGARGYINKRDAPDAIPRAIHTVLAGDIYMAPEQRRNPGGAAGIPLHEK